MKNLSDEIEGAKEKLIKINEDIAGLNCYLVFSNRFGQCELIEDFYEIFDKFPLFFEDGKYLSGALEVTEVIKEIKSGKRQVSKKFHETLATKRHHFIRVLTIRKDTNIEFRFHELRYDLIKRLKSHPLVQQPDHMMRDSYINIVLSRL